MNKRDLARLEKAHGHIIELTAFLLTTEKAQKKLARDPRAAECFGGRRSPLASARSAMLALSHLMNKAATRKGL